MRLIKKCSISKSAYLAARPVTDSFCTSANRQSQIVVRASLTINFMKFFQSFFLESHQEILKTDHEDATPAYEITSSSINIIKIPP